MQKRALVVLSGGQDSTTCLYWARERYDEVVALTFDYGQRHSLELEAAARIAAMAGVRQEVVALGPIFAGTSPLTAGELPVAHYASAEALPGGLEATFVPGRNLLFLAVAANRAYVEDCEAVVIGVSQEDCGGYPDCRADFLESMGQAISRALDREIRIEAPLLHLDKRESTLLAASLPGCMEALAWSHTCYEGVWPPCGTCHACLLRERGFREAGIADPVKAPR